jgi:ABC-2 type transport system permease protein
MTFLAVAWLGIRRVVRDPVGLLLSLAAPLALTVAIGLVANRAPFSPGPADGFDALSYIAPGLALFCMMLAVRQASKTMAEDDDRGVRARLRASPASAAAIRAGTVAAHVMTLFLQLAALVGVSTLLYGLTWGPPGAALLVCLAAAMAGGAWVALLAAVGGTPSRINSLGMMLTLVFGIVSRSFAAVIPSSPWMDAAARLTPNYWGQHAFSSLAMGLGLQPVLRDCGSLTLMCAVLWALAAIAGAPGARSRRQA